MLYATAVVWCEGGDVYDEGALREAWERRGDRGFDAYSGGPVTPNVYPLSIAPFLSPLALLPYRAALATWLAFQAVCIMTITTIILDAGRADKRAVAALVIVILSYPVLYGFSFGNIAVPIGCALFHTMRLRNRPLAAGALLGLALIKYSVAAPILLLYAFQRRFRLVATALAVQTALLLAGMGRYGSLNPSGWIHAMREVTSQTIQVGQTNHPESMEQTVVHLEVAALLHRLGVEYVTGTAVLAAGLMIALMYGLVFRRWAWAAMMGPAEACCLAVSLLVAYHRAYDLTTLLALALFLLAAGKGPVDRLLWIGVVVASLPTPAINDGQPTQWWWFNAFIHPSPAWGLLILACAFLYWICRTNASIPAPPHDAIGG